MEAEAAVKKLSRLPENCICANCGTTSRYGFSSVCIKYLTFVCNLCKTAHQAVSHRCKSLSMSSWDQGEVLKLKKHGNAHARKVWLAMAPQPGVGGRPKEGDDVNVFKRFVVTVYENKKYFRELEDGGAEDNVVAASQTRAPVYMSSSSRHTRPAAVPKPVSPKRVPKRAPAPKPAPAPAIVVDLLDFGAFDSAPAPAPAPSQAAPTATEDFTNFSQGQSIPPVAQPPFDPFNNRAQQNSNNIPTLAKLAPAPVANDPFAPSSSKLMTNANASNDPFAQPSSASTSNVSFDPFNNNATGTNNAASNGNMNQAKAPVMNNNMNIMSGGNNSMMNNNRGGMNSGMMTNGGMMNNNTNMMMNGGMMNNNNNMMMNGGMMNNNMGFTPQQQMMMMQQQQQNSFGRMNGMEQNIMNGGMSSNTGMGGNAMNTARPMNINVMQPMNNRISNNFGSTPAADPNKKPDPFSELGF